jgi:hypothetical protein
MHLNNSIKRLETLTTNYARYIISLCCIISVYEMLIKSHFYGRL